MLEAAGINPNYYFTKPLDFKQFVATIQVIEELWVASVAPPRPSAGR